MEAQVHLNKASVGVQTEKAAVDKGLELTGDLNVRTYIPELQTRYPVKFVENKRTVYNNRRRT